MGRYPSNMGRYFSSNLWSRCMHKTVNSYCRMRFFVTILRNLSSHTGAPAVPNFRYSVVSLAHPCRFTPKATYGNSNRKHSCTGPAPLLRKNTPAATRCYVARFYSSSNRDAFKAEAPIGISQEAQSDFSSIGERLGQSFHQLSKHINLYFRRQDSDVVSFVPNASVVIQSQKYHRTSQKHTQRKQSVTDEDEKDRKETPGTIRRAHLFHNSSLATRFGESYAYVASHINTVFSRGVSKTQEEENLGTFPFLRQSTRRRRRRKVPQPCSKISKPAEKTEVTLGSIEATHTGHNTSNSWEESYRYFARHINNYFSAKVTHNSNQNQQEKLSTVNGSVSKIQSTSKPQVAEREKAAPEGKGLFHSSSDATHFGENYFRMAAHINQYFKGQSHLERDVDESEMEFHPDRTTCERPHSVSLADCLRRPTSSIPSLLNAYLNRGPRVQTTGSKAAMTSVEAKLNGKLNLSHAEAEDISRVLLRGLGQASSPRALTAWVEALNVHLLRYPSCKALMWQEQTAVTLLRLRRIHNDNMVLLNAIRETLALVGFVDPVRGRGIRVLSIDGGGTRGVVPLQMLRLVEAETGKKVHQLFDYICGVSTGAVLAFMLGLARFSLEECAEMYRRFGSEVFRQNRLVGTVKMGWSHSYYNTETWETILQEKLGDTVLIKTARDEFSPKVSAVSAVVNWGNSPKAFVFRNYNHTPGSLSRYAGGSAFQMWQAVRASSAAPGYFQEFTLQSDIHQDGGIILNNPCALAVHESRLLWPNQPFQCVLSLGTGRYDNTKRGPATSTSLRAKIGNLISSATDTEGVHTLLDDLLAPDVYFRLNPMLSAEVSLDESRSGALDQLQKDTQVYLERNQHKLARMCSVLRAERSAASRTKDWVSERAWEMRQRWV